MGQVSLRPGSDLRTNDALRRLGRPVWLFAHFVLFAVFARSAISHNFGDAAFGFDGCYYFELARTQHDWAPLTLGFFANPLQGMSDIFFPLNADILPSLFLPHMLPGAAKTASEYIILCYTIASIELFLSMLVLARSMGLGWSRATIAAWALPILCEPYFGHPLLFPILSSAPTFSTVFASVALMMAVINRLGAGPDRAWAIVQRDLPWVLLLLLLAIFLIA